MWTTPKRDVLVYLNGWPGTGKLTIGTLLHERLPRSRFLHNHLVIELAGAIASKKDYAHVRQCVHTKAIECMLESMQKEEESVVAIMTGAHAGGEFDTGVLSNAMATAAKYEDVVVVGVLLVCDLEENQRRLVSADRIGKKLTNPATLEMFATTRQLLDDMPNLLRLDTSRLTPEEAADSILQHLQQVLES